MSMLIIVCYDVNTETREGRRRLRRVAKVCEGVGQRVQKSVFECRVDRMQYEDLERRLLAEINDKEDNLRLYRLAESKGCEVKEHGVFRATNFEAPLVVCKFCCLARTLSGGGFAERFAESIGN